MIVIIILLLILSVLLFGASAVRGLLAKTSAVVGVVIVFGLSLSVFSHFLGDFSLYIVLGIIGLFACILIAWDADGKNVKAGGKFERLEAQRTWEPYAAQLEPLMTARELADVSNAVRLNHVPKLVQLREALIVKYDPTLK